MPFVAFVLCDSMTMCQKNMTNAGALQLLVRDAKWETKICFSLSFVLSSQNRLHALRESARFVYGDKDILIFL
ncbi:MAG: hypothetical protein IJ319_03130 [Bacteroidaceae bacterium]|nr:hypothetical protein [Bacteroidaceae bacterium]